MGHQKSHNTLAKFFFFGLFGALFALMLGAGAGYFLHAEAHTAALCETMSFKGPGIPLELSQKEIRGLNNSAEKWEKNFHAISVEWFPKGPVEILEPETLLECNLIIQTTDNQNIVMRKKSMSRKNMVEVVVRQVDHAGEEYSLFRHKQGNCASEIRTIHL